MYILAHKFGDNGTYYVRVNDNDTWDELESPVQATLFTSAQRAVTWSKENTTFGEYAKGFKFNSELKKYQKYVEGGMVRRSFDVLDKTLSRKYNGESPKEVLDWWIVVKGEEEGIRFEDYKTWPNLCTVYKYLFNTQTWNSKDYTKKYLTFEMRVPRDGVFEEFKKELDLVVDRVELLDEDGNKVISIFDHHLNADGGRSFVIRKDGTYAIKGRWSDNVEGTLEEVFEYWKTYRYYD